MKTKLTPRSSVSRSEHLDGKVGGLWKSPNKFFRLQSYPLPEFHFITSDYPEFERFVYGKEVHFTYHLSGYGKLYNETKMSFLGESAERFAYATQYLILKHVIVKKSYNQLIEECKREDNESFVCPLSYVNHLYRAGDSNYIGDDDVISWVRMISLVKPDATVYVPMQLVISGTDRLVDNEKIAVANAVSTGTASHENFKNSLEASIIETMQLDSFNLYWYGGLACPEITDDFTTIIHHILGQNDCFLDYFKINLIDISLDKPIHVVMCEITSDFDFMPKYTVGIQGAYSLERAVYRAIMETLAILEYNMNIPWTNPEKYKQSVDKEVFDNLDDNVVHYSRLGKPVLSFSESPLQSTEKVFSLKELLKKLKSMSKYAGFLNITPPDFIGCNQVITRVIVPEFIPLCIPSFPQRQHPRYQQIGGIKNDLEHPLP